MEATPFFKHTRIRIGEVNTTTRVRCEVRRGLLGGEMGRVSSIVNVDTGWDEEIKMGVRFGDEGGNVELRGEYEYE